MRQKLLAGIDIVTAGIMGRWNWIRKCYAHIHSDGLYGLDDVITCSRVWSSMGCYKC
jgi:hypothetical protein